MNNSMKNTDHLDRLIGIVVICMVIIAASIIGIRIWQKNRDASAIKPADAKPARSDAKAPLEITAAPLKNPLSNNSLPVEKKLSATKKPGMETLNPAALPLRDAPAAAEKSISTIVEAETAANPTQVIDYEKLSENTRTQSLMQQRKKDLGIYGGIDIVAKPDEVIKVGDTAVSMKKILEQIRIKEGEIVEEDLAEEKTAYTSQDGSGGAESMPGSKRYKIYKNIGQKLPIQKDEIYGIHIVRPGENIWNIHFTFLKSYFEHRGVQLSPVSDEPNDRGASSGVGKLLKFSEKMVYIYNLRLQRIDTDLDLIHPLSKIVVFRMKQVFTLLDQIDYDRISRIQFDGETLWLPAS